MVAVARRMEEAMACHYRGGSRYFLRQYAKIPSPHKPNEAAMATLSTIHLYPIKSTAGRMQESAWVGVEGIVGDRRFMVAKPDGTLSNRPHTPSVAARDRNIRRSDAEPVASATARVGARAGDLRSGDLCHHGMGRRLRCLDHACTPRCLVQ
ncbi:MOSC N-terminal beta barrel domain-containing protein [Chromohalobacter canadensis]|uniref:MOSC N-terminal beta barrel domain-containing protein n=1 Tax=Chromohalobacter canadensis TaxID=141389 RepID=UPI0035E7629F